MTDEPTPTDPEIEAAVAEIREGIAADEKAAAEAQAAEEARIEKMNAAKQVCLDRCGPIDDAIANAESDAERSALTQLAIERHAEHKDALEAAYAEFAGPPPSDVSTGSANLTANITVASQAEA